MAEREAWLRVFKLIITMNQNDISIPEMNPYILEKRCIWGGSNWPYYGLVSQARCLNSSSITAEGTSFKSKMLRD